MALFRVTATAIFDFDTDEQEWIESAEDAQAEAEDFLASEGGLAHFDFTVETIKSIEEDHD